jgi:pimeloyl-ACP methyl ester carboxylesterase
VTTGRFGFDRLQDDTLDQTAVISAPRLAYLLRGAGRQLENLSRRAALARASAPAGVSGPPARLLFAEMGALSRTRVADTQRPIPVAKQPQPVMLLPGFFSHPRRMRPLKVALEQAGHAVEDWGLGFNLGPTPENFAGLLRRVERMARGHGEPVALVGWSLGGLFAREVACRLPESVARVITMGTPFSGDPHANNAWRAYQFVTGRAVDDPPSSSMDRPSRRCRRLPCGARATA